MIFLSTEWVYNEGPAIYNQEACPSQAPDLLMYWSWMPSL